MQHANLKEILVFMAVADEGSFVAGGRSMGLTRSTAGKAVSRLEDRLGVRLFNRTTRALSLTDDGRVFHEQGLQVLAAVHEAEASVSARAVKPRGLLRITVPDAYGRLVILPIVKSYLEAWPDVQVEISFTDRQADIVEEGFDLAIRIGNVAADSRLVSRAVATYEAVLCASPAYLSERGKPKTLAELQGHDCLVFSSRNRRQSWRFRAADGGWDTAPVRGRLRLDSGQAIRDAALAGLGIAYLPSFLVASELADRGLRRILPDLQAESVTVSAIYPTRRLLAPRVRHFMDFLAQRLKKQR
ncbi:MAG: LysR family transcriptional regulator [Rhizobacter sp.]